MLKAIAKLLKALNSETEPWQISLAFCFSMVAGLTPLFSLHNVFILLLVLLLRVNLSTFVVGLTMFSGVAYMLDPLFDRIGLAVLTSRSLETLWTGMYNSAFWRLEQFNNSIVMGSLVFSLIFFAPLFFLAGFLIVKYREKVLQRIGKTKVMRLLKASKFYSAYKTVSGWRGPA